MRYVVDLVLGAVAGLAGAVLVLRLARRRHGQRPVGTTHALAGGGQAPAPSTGSPLVPVPPGRLPKFGDVGGMAPVKAELRNTLGLVLDNPERARHYRITWNGVLLHGPPGTGKSFLARAMAGEFGCQLIEVDTCDLVTAVVGDGPRRVEHAFELAAQHLPCVLLFDELDAVAGSRADQADLGDRAEVLSQLLQCLEDWRREPRLVVVATTNELEALDSAVIRPGRFDRHVRIDVPDLDGRRAVLESALCGRPARPDLDLSAIARRTAGQTPASLVQAVELAALAALRESTGTGKVVQITERHLEEALEQRGGHDRPTVEHWSWDRLVLDPRVLVELRQIQELIENTEQSERYGVDPPSGLLLTGVPGTGKTTVAKVLAAEASCSFYPVTVADLTNKWVGESERAVARLFRRARANAPSIVFLDEIDAIGANRGGISAYDRQLDQLLAEIDGMASTPGVYVIGATNRPQAVDPALRRGGRLSRTIHLPLPDTEQRRRMLELQAATMPLLGVELDALAADTEGFSGADLKALLQQAALEAMIRQHEEDGPAGITPADVARARDLGEREVSDHASVDSTAPRPSRKNRLRAR